MTILTFEDSDRKHFVFFLLLFSSMVCLKEKREKGVKNMQFCSQFLINCSFFSQLFVMWEKLCSVLPFSFFFFAFFSPFLFFSSFLCNLYCTLNSIRMNRVSRTEPKRRGEVCYLKLFQWYRCGIWLPVVLETVRVSMQCNQHSRGRARGWKNGKCWNGQISFVRFSFNDQSASYR